MSEEEDFMIHFFNILKENQTLEQRACKHDLVSQMKDMKWFCPSCKLESKP